VNRKESNLNKINRFSVLAPIIAWHETENHLKPACDGPGGYSLEIAHKKLFFERDVASDLTVIRARAGLVRARTVLANTARGLARATASGCAGAMCAIMNSEKAESGTPTGARVVAGGDRVAERTNPRVQRTDRGSGTGEVSASSAAEAVEEAWAC
jgi:hypothetical protein